MKVAIPSIGSGTEKNALEMLESGGIERSPEAPGPGPEAPELSHDLDPKAPEPPDLSPNFKDPIHLGSRRDRGVGRGQGRGRRGRRRKRARSSQRDQYLQG